MPFKQIIPSVLWRCSLGVRKGIRPVKYWVVGRWHGYLSGARCKLAYGPADATATHCLLLFYLFWYQLTRAVPEKGPLNGCVCVCLSNNKARELSMYSSYIWSIASTVIITGIISACWNLTRQIDVKDQSMRWITPTITSTGVTGHQ